jgi:hypothetical protein
MAKSKTKEKIYEYNPDSKVIRWRYVNEDPQKFGWPNYGRILKEKKNARTNNKRSKSTR